MKRGLLFSLLLLLIFFLSIKLTSKTKTDRAFELSLEELMNIKIVTAGKKEEKLSEIPASAILITRKEIEKYGYNSLEEILSNVPGLYPIYDWTLSNNFGVRGFWSLEANTNISIMVNGVNQLNDAISANILTNVNISVEAIDRIEIIRGPMSIIYGSGAFFGAINIITNKTDMDSSSSIVSGYTGLNGEHGLFARTAGHNENIKFVFNSSITNSFVDQPFSKIIDSVLTQDGLVSQNMGTSKNFTKCNKRHVDLFGSIGSFYANLSFDEYEGSLLAWVLPVLDHYGKAKDTITRISFGINKEISDSLRIDGKLFFNSTTLSRDFAFSPNDWGIQYLEANSFGVDLNTFINPSSKTDITLGFNYKRIFDISNFYDIPDWLLPNYYSHTNNDPIITQALYAQIKYRFMDNLLLVAGGRLEQMLPYDLVSEQAYGLSDAVIYRGKYDYKKIQFIPRFAIIYSLNSHHIFKLLYGKAINHPSFFENHDMLIWPQKSTLIPQEIRTIEFNYLSLISPKLSLHLSIFKNNMNKLIIRDQGFDENNIYYNYKSNTGNKRTSGIELQLNYRLFENLQFDLAMTYQKSKDENHPHIDMAYAPNILGYFKMVYQLKKNIILGITGNYVDKMNPEYSHTPINNQDPNSPKIGFIGDNVKDYIIVNTNLRFEDFLIQGMYLTLKISNLFDTNIFYPTTSYSVWTRKGTIAPGRRFFIKLGWEF